MEYELKTRLSVLPVPGLLVATTNGAQASWSVSGCESQMLIVDCFNTPTGSIDFFLECSEDNVSFMRCNADLITGRSPAAIVRNEPGLLFATPDLTAQTLYTFGTREKNFFYRLALDNAVASNVLINCYSVLDNALHVPTTENIW